MELTPEQRAAGRNDRLIASAIALAAALLFSLQIFGLQDAASQFSKYPTAALQYLGSAMAPERLLDFSPLYLGLHIAAFRFMADPLGTMLWMHISVLSLAAALTYLILRRHAGRALSLGGAVVLLLSRSVVIFGYVFEPEPFMLFFLVALVYFAGRRDPLSAAAAGISLTLCILTRPTFFPLILIVPLYFVLRHRGLRQALPGIMLFLLPVIMGFLFIGIRNYLLQGQVSLWFMSPGTVFFDGNNPLSEGTRAAYPPLINDMADQFPGESDYEHAVYRQVARAVAGSSISPTEANRFWAGKAAAYLSDHPGRFLALTARRLFLLFHSYRWYDLATAWSADEVLEKRGMPFFPFAPLSALALVGMAAASLSWRQHFLAYAVFLNQAALMALTYATDRQRVGLYPFFIYFAVLGLSWLLTHKRGRLVAISVFLPLALVLSLPSDRMRDDRHLWEGIARTASLLPEAMQARDALDHPTALQKTAQMLAASPWRMGSGRPAGLTADSSTLLAGAVDLLSSRSGDTPSARFDRALLLIELSRLDEAEHLLTALAGEGIRFDPLNGRNPEPLYHLGRIATLRKKREEAVQYLREALRRSPGDPEVLALLGCMTGEEAPVERLFRYYDDADGHLFLGRACLESDEPQKAVDHLARLAALQPDYVKGKIYLAAALSRAGRYREGALLYLSTAGAHPPLIILDDPILRLFGRWAQDGSRESLYWHGMVLRQYGHPVQALRVLRTAAKAGHPLAKKEYPMLRDSLKGR